MVIIKSLGFNGVKYDPYNIPEGVLRELLDWLAEGESLEPVEEKRTPT